MGATPHFRAFPRREMVLPASVEGPPGDRRPARLLNIGLGGACVECAETVELGQKVTLRVETPVLWDPLVVHGRVAWVERDGADSTRVGLRFDHERSRVIRALFELLAIEDFE